MDAFACLLFLSAPHVCLVPKEARRVLDPLQLELWTVELPYWVLGMKPGSSGRTPVLLITGPLSSSFSIHFLLCVGLLMAPRLTSQVRPVDRQGRCKILNCYQSMSWDSSGCTVTVTWGWVRIPDPFIAMWSRRRILQLFPYM